MKLLQTSLLAACAPVVAARFIEPLERNNVDLGLATTEKFLVEIAPGKTAWITEDEKWELRRQGQNFIDITETQDLGSSSFARSASTVKFPQNLSHQLSVAKLTGSLSKDNMKANLEKLTSFHTRYYKSESGRESSDWVLSKVKQIIKDAGAEKTVRAKNFGHTWQQSSTIVTIPGQTNQTIVIGAHQDSINLFFPSIFAAPGADDDGSGTVTIMEVLKAILGSKDIVDGKAHNTIEFHWYSAEEGGLLGSQAIFSSYERERRDVKAMLQQDMTGYVQGTLDAGKPEAVGVITDFVDAGLTKFIKTVIEGYCDIPWVETKCGYACSDHASASKAGYPSAFVIESAFEDSDKKIHSTDDLIKYLSFDHMLQHAKMTLGLAYELAQHPFEEKAKDSDADEL